MLKKYQLSYPELHFFSNEHCGFICSTTTFTQNPQPIITARENEDLTLVCKISRGK